MLTTKPCNILTKIIMAKKRIEKFIKLLIEMFRMKCKG